MRVSKVIGIAVATVWAGMLGAPIPSASADPCSDVEVIFARPGLGTLIYDSIESRNYPVVRGGVLVVAILFVTCNLLADLSYRFLDPRIRAEQGL